jgi:hypothetical protein
VFDGKGVNCGDGEEGGEEERKKGRREEGK